MANNHKNSGGGPKSRTSRDPHGIQAINSVPEYQVSFDPSAFDNLLATHGIRVKHFRAIPDPTGMASKGDTHDVLGIRQSSDGFIYKEIGCVQVLLQSNNTTVDVAGEGTLSFASAYMTMPRFYENSENPIIASPWDRFFISDIEIRVINMQYIEASSIGTDRLQYPATCVEHLIDANGIEYFEGTDFNITPDGHIQWLTQKRPGWNPTVNRGTVYAIRYRYQPFFVVSKLVHEIRYAQVTDPATFTRNVERLPYQLFVLREHVFHDTNRDPNKPLVDERYQYAPPSGGNLGPK